MAEEISANNTTALLESTGEARVFHVGVWSEDELEQGWGWYGGNDEIAAGKSVQSTNGLVRLSSQGFFSRPLPGDEYLKAGAGAAVEVFVHCPRVALGAISAESEPLPLQGGIVLLSKGSALVCLVCWQSNPDDAGSFYSPARVTLERVVCTPSCGIREATVAIIAAGQEGCEVLGSVESPRVSHASPDTQAAPGVLLRFELSPDKSTTTAFVGASTNCLQIVGRASAPNEEPIQSSESEVPKNEGPPGPQQQC